LDGEYSQSALALFPGYMGGDREMLSSHSACKYAWYVASNCGLDYTLLPEI